MNEEKHFETDGVDLSFFSDQGKGTGSGNSASPRSASREETVSVGVRKNKGRHYKKKTSKFGRWWRNLKRWKKVAIISAVSLVLVVAVSIGAFWGVLKGIYNKNVLDKDFNADGVDAVGIIDKNVFNIALFGIDTRSITSKDDNAYQGLSDSIMIMSLNTKLKKVKIISVMRDSLVPIDELKENAKTGKKEKVSTTYTKINAAYAKGGPELAVRTLNQIFELDIRDYATVNFAGMADIIDAVDGIDVTLAQGELDVYVYEKGRRINVGFNGLMEEQCRLLGRDPSGLYIKKAGTYHLNGVQAVAYARIRHAANVEGTNNDYGRTDRQRYVMEQLFNKAVKMKKSQYSKLAESMLPCCRTSLQFEKVVGLAMNVLAASPTFEQTRVPLTEYQMPNSGYVYYDLAYAGKLIRAFIYQHITPEEYMEKNGIEKNDWYARRRSGGSKNSGGSDSAGKTASKISGTDEVTDPSDGDLSPDTDPDNTGTASLIEGSDPDTEGPDDGTGSSDQKTSPDDGETDPNTDGSGTTSEKEGTDGGGKDPSGNTGNPSDQGNASEPSQGTGQQNPGTEKTPAQEG